MLSLPSSSLKQHAMHQQRCCSLAGCVLSPLHAGGWFPIALSVVVFVISSIWFYGRQRKSEYSKSHAQYLESVLHLPGSR